MVLQYSDDEDCLEESKNGQGIFESINVYNYRINIKWLADQIREGLKIKGNKKRGASIIIKQT